VALAEDDLGCVASELAAQRVADERFGELSGADGARPLLEVAPCGVKQRRA
jgi:hypothetical protein